MAILEREPKTFSELRQMIADLSGLKPNLISVHRIGLEGNFGATVIAGVINASSGAERSNVEAICESLRSKYTVKG